MFEKLFKRFDRLLGIAKLENKLLDSIKAGGGAKLGGKAFTLVNRFIKLICGLTSGMVFIFCLLSLGLWVAVVIVEPDNTADLQELCVMFLTSLVLFIVFFWFYRCVGMFDRIIK